MTVEELKSQIDAIEESYEFFLAYAAQGLTDDAASKVGGQVREYLKRCEAALEVLVDGFKAHIPNAGDHADVIQVLERDVEACRALVRLTRAQPTVSSQLIDNLNASIHVRALLTDLFVLDDVLPV